MQLGHGCGPCPLPEGSEHLLSHELTSSPWSPLPHLVLWGNFPLPSPAWVWLFIPEQCKRIRVNWNICPNVLSVKCFTARKTECRNRERVYILNDLKTRNNLRQWVGKSYSSWLLACWVEQPEILHYRYQTWWPQQIQWIHALLSRWSHRDWWVQI